MTTETEVSIRIWAFVAAVISCFILWRWLTAEARALDRRSVTRTYDMDDDRLW